MAGSTGQSLSWSRGGPWPWPPSIVLQSSCLCHRRRSSLSTFLVPWTNNLVISPQHLAELHRHTAGVGVL